MTYLTVLTVLIAFGAWLALSVLIAKCVDFGLNGRSHLPPERHMASGIAPVPLAGAGPLELWDAEAELAGMDWSW